MKALQSETVDAVNQVRLVGRISQPPHERVLPSGDAVWTFRVIVARPQRSLQTRARNGTRQQVDALECAAWTPRAQRSVKAWNAGDTVEVSGALRRRFFGAGGGAASRCEVEMTSGRIIRRAGTA